MHTPWNSTHLIRNLENKKIVSFLYNLKLIVYWLKNWTTTLWIIEDTSLKVNELLIKREESDMEYQLWREEWNLEHIYNKEKIEKDFDLSRKESDLEWVVIKEISIKKSAIDLAYVKKHWFISNEEYEKKSKIKNIWLEKDYKIKIIENEYNIKRKELEDWYKQENIKLEQELKIKIEEIKKEIDLEKLNAKKDFIKVKKNNITTLWLLKLENWLKIKQKQLKIFTWDLYWYIQIVQKFQLIFDLLNPFSKLFNNYDRKVFHISNKNWFNLEEFGKALAIRIINLFIKSWEKYEKTWKLILDKIDLEANIVAQIFSNLKEKKWLNLDDIPFLTYSNWPNFPQDNDNPNNEKLFKKMTELYQVNYDWEEEFLEIVLPKLRDKFSWKSEFKTLYWDKTWKENFQNDPENLIGFLYFSDYDSKNWKKAKYLWWVNLDPNFQKSWIATFIKKAIKDEFDNWTEEIYLNTINWSEAEEMWKIFWFEYFSYWKNVPKKNGSFIYNINLKLTKEKFNQVFSKFQ